MLSLKRNGAPFLWNGCAVLAEYALYTEDVKNYVKLNTWLTKEHIVDTKILPYFRNLKMNEITPGDVRKWQNEMVAFRYKNGKSYSQTYKKTILNI